MGAASAYGGQAVLEGVMMRGPLGMAVAVRRADQDISVRVRSQALPTAFPWKLPVLRGLAALADSLVLGTHALLYSAELLAGDLDATASSGAPGATTGVAEIRGAHTDGMRWTLALSGTVGIGVFIILPTVAAGWLRRALPSAAAAAILEGILRLVLLLGYILAITAVGEIRRVLQYHGAEHKALAALEAGMPLEAELVAARCSRFHPRCGTSFLLFVVLVAGFGYALLGWQGLVVRILLRLALLPLVAGLGYEVLRASARGRGRLAAIVTRPGLWLQHLTTREPDAAQVAVAIAALGAAIALDPDNPGEEREWA